jgi:putative membrane protein
MTASEHGASLLDGAPRRLHPASPVLDLVLSARQWAFPLVILLVTSGQSLILGPAAVGILALVVGWKVIVWRRFTYQLVGDVLVIEQGVLQRSRREVPVARIQQVDLRRKLRHRALGVAVVRVDTAGGGSGAEVSLEAIADEEAAVLRSALLDRRRATAPAAPSAPGVLAPGGGSGTGPWSPADPAAAAAPAPPPPPPPPPPVVEVVALSPWELVVAGITGSRLLASVPLAAAAVGLLFELPAETSDGIIGRLPTGTVALVAGLVAVAPLMLAAAVASSLLTDFGFTLVRVGSDLHLRRGLLDQREATLSLRRVQVVRVHQNLLRRRLGLASVQLQSAGSGSAAEGEVTRLTIPFVRSAQLGALLGQVLPVSAEHPDLIPAPPPARRRAWVRRVVPALLLLGILAVALTITASTWAVLLLLLVVPVAVESELVYRNLGHVGTPSLVVARSGGFVQETAYVPVAKTQSTALRSSPFQRRLGLASLHVHVAGSGEVPVVHDGDADRLARLRRGALHASVARQDEADVRRRTRQAAANAEPVTADAATGGADVGPDAGPHGSV